MENNIEELNLNFNSELKRFEKHINNQAQKTAKAINRNFRSYRTDQFLSLNQNSMTFEDIKSEMTLELWKAIEDFKTLYKDKNILGKFRLYCGFVHVYLKNRRFKLIRENSTEKSGRGIAFLDSEESNNLFYGNTPRYKED